jgi:hypothetical protein
MGILPMHREVTPGGQVMPVRFGAPTRRFSYRSQIRPDARRLLKVHGLEAHATGFRPYHSACTICLDN